MLGILCIIQKISSTSTFLFLKIILLLWFHISSITVSHTYLHTKFWSLLSLVLPTCHIYLLYPHPFPHQILVFTMPSPTYLSHLSQIFCTTLQLMSKWKVVFNFFWIISFLILIPFFFQISLSWQSIQHYSPCKKLCGRQDFQAQ